MSPRMAWALGFVCLVVGLTPMLQVGGFFPIAPDSSRWVMVGVGALFIAGGGRWSSVTGFHAERVRRTFSSWLNISLR